MRTHRLVLPFLLLAPATAGEYTVDPKGKGDFTTVIEALAAVEDGDTVRVLPGTYYGLHVVDRVILLEGVDGSDATTLDAGTAGTVLTISAAATVQGFTIRGGGGPGVSTGGVKITTTGSEPATLRDCLVTENHAAGDFGLPVGGVLVDTSAYARLVDNVISANSALSAGGLVTGPFSHVDLIGNTIKGNGGTKTTTGGVLWGATGRLVNNQITGNFGTGIGGLYLLGGLGDEPEGAKIDVVNCTVVGNRATSDKGSSGGIHLADGGKIKIVNTISYDNAGIPLMDLGASPSFWTKGALSLSYSHLKLPGPTIPPGTFMVPSFMDPGFVDPIPPPAGGPTLLGDYHLTAASAEIGEGDKSAFPLDAAAGDLGRILRVRGKGIDVGAFEFGKSCEAPVYYGLGKTSSLGERPFLISVGEPSVAGGKFHLEMHDATPASECIVAQGEEPGFQPVIGGMLWVKHSPGPVIVKETDLLGSVSFGVKLDPVLVGETRYFQAWFRDSGIDDGSSAGLSSAVKVTFCP